MDTNNFSQTVSDEEVSSLVDQLENIRQEDYYDNTEVEIDLDDDILTLEQEIDALRIENRNREQEMRLYVYEPLDNGDNFTRRDTYTHGYGER